MRIETGAAEGIAGDLMQLPEVPADMAPAIYLSGKPGGEPL